MIHPDGTVTEFAYDCEGNLERTWDANHPSGNQTNPATQVYTYDLLNRADRRHASPGAAVAAARRPATPTTRRTIVRVTDANGTVTSYRLRATATC